MRVVITGGSGLIGSALARELGGAGQDVVVLTRDAGKAGALPAGVRAVQWDGRTAAGWGSLLDGDTVLVHLAGESIASGRWTEDRKRRIRDSRVGSGKAVLQAIREAAVKPRALLQGSAVGYYGPHGDEVIREDAAPGDDFLAGVCKEWEASTAEAEALGVRRAILRTGVVLAREGGALPKMTLPFKLMAGGPLGNGRQWFPWIHLADEVGAIRFLAESTEATGPFNLTAPNPVTNRELAGILASVLHRPGFMPAPGFALRLALGEMADMLLNGQRVVPSRLQELGYRFKYPGAEPALRGLLD
ncbi:MAG TPA: TIGR01777 family oxidoreductase [Thermoanaerobaculia bacterium]|jgi:hypothetical protein|nr:TIGR01777 family oxidoreductase [Thermoanaerobaculia bacterium]